MTVCEDVRLPLSRPISCMPPSPSPPLHRTQTHRGTQKHKELERCFDELNVDDRKRMQVNAGIQAASKRDAFFPTAELERKFEDRFYLRGMVVVGSVCVC